MITPAIIMTYFVLLLSTSLTFILFFIDHQKQVRALAKPDPAAAIVSVSLHMLYGLLLLVDLLWTVEWMRTRCYTIMVNMKQTNFLNRG